MTQERFDQLLAQGKVITDPRPESDPKYKKQILVINIGLFKQGELDEFTTMYHRAIFDVASKCED